MGLTSSPLRSFAIAHRHTHVFLLKFTFFIFSMENLSFGHSVAIFSLCGAVACLLKSNLRPSSTKNILRFFVFLRLSLVGILLKFTFIIFSAENLSFGHSVAICSLYGAYAYLLTSNLRLSLKISPSEIFFASSHFFVTPHPATPNNTKKPPSGGLLCYWSGQWDSDPRHQPWQGCALPLSYTRILIEQNLLYHKKSKKQELFYNFLHFFYFIYFYAIFKLFIIYNIIKNCKFDINLC